MNIRTYRADDLPACRVLYREGLLGGKIAENDTGLDIDDIEVAYLADPGNHFWVAERAEEGRPTEVLGMIGVQKHDEASAEIRRLRVRHDSLRRGIGTKLLESAIRFCHEKGYIKVVLDTFIDREPALRLFDKFRFRHSRTREVSGKEMLYFYLDLYHKPKGSSD